MLQMHEPDENTRPDNQRPSQCPCRTVEALIVDVGLAKEFLDRLDANLEMHNRMLRAICLKLAVEVPTDD